MGRVINHTSLKLVTDATTEPCTTAELKSHLRIDHSNDDSLIDLYIKTARRYVEQVTGRALINQTWEMYLDQFPSDMRDVWWDGMKDGPVTDLFTLRRHIEIPKVPLSSITSLTTYDDSDSGTVFSTSNYYVDANQEPGRLSLRNGSSWPSGTFRTSSGIKIVFVAGYGSAASSVPEDIKTAIKIMVSSFYEHRGELESKSSSFIQLVPNMAMVMLQHYIFKRI